MIETLQKYYEEKGILSTNFECKHKRSCTANCDEFTGPKSAFVSSGYALGKVPRLLFLSLDSGSGQKDDRDRLPRSVREQEEVKRDVSCLNKGQHWYRTNELAWYILRRFDPKIDIGSVKSLFAHANSAKCCMNKPHRAMADRVLFKNCREYIPDEIRILDPDIIVTQGDPAKAAMDSIRDKEVSRQDKFAAVVQLNGKDVFWLHTYHPRYFGGFSRQRDFDKSTNQAMGWIRYADAIHRFVQTSH